MYRLALVTVVSISLLASACVSLPSGPNVMVLPGSGVSFDQFRNDAALCEHYAFSQIGGTTPNQAAFNSGISSAAVGTALGAAAGAAIGGGRGAAVGAGTGLLGGSMVGSGAAMSSSEVAQQRYDAAYIQCMYAKGHQVPVSGQFSNVIPQISTPPTLNIPPPPPGAPPPPPN